MRISYQSTRGGEQGVTASQAILKGLACDGGLFMPTELPKLDLTMKELAGKTYQETAYEVMKLFLTDFTEEELKYCIEKAYDSKFDTETIAPLVKADGAYYLELFHGSTIAFKDMALSILPYFMTTAAKKNHADKEIVILTATSGDTGKAAMAGFADVPGTRIIVFYPKDGVSRVQELQMVTQKGDNTSVVAIHGNFDDAQTGVKKIFADKEFGAELADHGFQFSSANSINIGRLVPQVVYYVYAYASLLANEEIKDGEEINVTVIFVDARFVIRRVDAHFPPGFMNPITGLNDGRSEKTDVEHACRLDEFFIQVGNVERTATSGIAEKLLAFVVPLRDADVEVRPFSGIDGQMRRVHMVEPEVRDVRVPRLVVAHDAEDGAFQSQSAGGRKRRRNISAALKTTAVQLGVGVGLREFFHFYRKVQDRIADPDEINCFFHDRIPSMAPWRWF